MVVFRLCRRISGSIVPKVTYIGASVLETGQIRSAILEEFSMELGCISRVPESQEEGCKSPVSSAPFADNSSAFSFTKAAEIEVIKNHEIGSNFEIGSILPSWF